MENPIQKYYSFEKIQGQVLEIARQLQQTGFRPDYIVGITRGGLIPATLLSHYLNVNLETLKVNLRDNFGVSESESNCWMAEDALQGKNILVVDDINDSGATINWIKKDWEASCFANQADWNTVWHNNVRFAVLIDNEESEATIDYSAWDINKAANPEWCVFHWEEWWKWAK